MDHDVYICYDKKDEKLSESVSRILEANGISCWFESRDFSSSDTVEKISHVIEAADAVVLVYSKNSRNNNYVTSEIDLAFTHKIPILVFFIDESTQEGELEFFMKNKPQLSAYPNPNVQLKLLVRKTAELIGKGIDNPSVGEDEVRLFEKMRPKPQGQRIKRFAAVAILIIAVLAVVYLVFIVPAGHHTTDDGTFSMRMTDVSVRENDGKYRYRIFGESYNMPSDSKNYIMKTRCYDVEGNLVYSENSTADEFSHGLICYFDKEKKNITDITFELVDLNNNVISNDSYRTPGDL
jgi:hypothetical protein